MYQPNKHRANVSIDTVTQYLYGLMNKLIQLHHTVEWLKYSS
jgi:hypothetical protein